MGDTKREEYEKLMRAFERNKLVSKNILNKVAKARLEEFCTLQRIEVPGKLKPDYIVALQTWVSALDLYRVIFEGDISRLSTKTK